MIAADSNGRQRTSVSLYGLRPMPVSERPVMGADDRPNLTAADHSTWHPVELTYASERQRQLDQLPNHALLDQARRLRRRGPDVSAAALPWRPRGARRATPHGPALSAWSSAPGTGWIGSGQDASARRRAWPKRSQRGSAGTLTTAQIKTSGGS